MLQRARRRGSKFLNPIPTQVGGLSMIFRVLPRYLTNRKQRFPLIAPGPFETDPRVYTEAPASGLRVTWFGHSSMLLEIDGVRILVDPIWELRASPFQWSGPKRFFSPTLFLSDLPPIDIVLISHDHYDHLGETTVRNLAAQKNASAALWITSKGVGALLNKWGVSQAKIVELDWTETHVSTIRDNGFKITAWPTRHFSGRKLSNRFETLWSSFAIEGSKHAVFYGADSGQWPGFSEIGRQHRRFDLTMLEIGAFDPLWADIHLGPDGAIAAFTAMNTGGLLMPIHWGLFDLALHGWAEPIERLERVAREQGVPLWAPEPGLPTEVLGDVEVRSDWWRNSSVESV